MDSLSLLLEHEREEAEVQRAQMKEEMEVVLGELALIEGQESRMQEEMDQSLQRLQQENHHLVQQLSQASASLDRWDVEDCLSCIHFVNVMQLPSSGCKPCKIQSNFSVYLICIC